MILAFFSSLLNQRKMPSPGKFWASDQRLKSIPRLKRCDDIGLPARSRLVQRDVGEIQLFSHLLLLSFPITHLLYPGRLSSNREAGRKKEWRMEGEAMGEKRDRQIKSNLLGCLWGCRYAPDGDPELDGLHCGNNPLWLIESLGNHLWSNKNAETRWPSSQQGHLKK